MVETYESVLYVSDKIVMEETYTPFNCKCTAWNGEKMLSKGNCT